MTGVRKFLVAGCAFLAVAAAGSVAAVMIPTCISPGRATTRPAVSQ